METFMFGGGFEVIFFLMFFLIALVIIVQLFMGISTWNKNNHSPRLTVDAKIVTKRCNVTHHNDFNGGDVTGAHGMHTSTDTTYYVTFEVQSGDRIELRVKGQEYGMMAEGDIGKLTFQGTRYISFERQYK